MKFLYKTLGFALLPFFCTPALAQLPQLDWYKTFYATGPMASVAIGAIQTSFDGSMVLSGVFDGVIDIDPGPGTQILDKADGGFFFAKFDQRGNLLWARQLPVSVGAWNLNPETGWIAYAARFTASYDFDPGPRSHVLHPAARSLALVRLDADGNFKGANDVRLDADITGLAINVKGRIFLAGSFYTPTAFDPNYPATRLIPRGKGDGFVAIYNTELSLQHAFAIGGADDDRPFTVMSTADGFVVGGSFTNTANFHPGSGSETLTASGAGGFIATYKIDQPGVSLSRLVRMGTWVSQIALDPRSSQMTITGSVGDSMDADPGPGVSMLYPFGYIDQFVSHTRADGSFGFGRVIGIGLSQPNTRISASSNGDVLYGGTLYHPLDIEVAQVNVTLTPNGVMDMFMHKFREDGSHHYGFCLGTAGKGTSATTSVASNGALLVAGFTNGTLDLDPGPGTTSINQNNESATFLARYKDENTLGMVSSTSSDVIRIHSAGRAAIIDFTGCSSVDATIAVNDISGRRILQASHRNTDMRRVDLANLPAGIYVVTVRNGFSTITEKIVVRD